MSKCQVRQEGDEFACKCGMRWGVGEAPSCPSTNGHSHSAVVTAGHFHVLPPFLGQCFTMQVPVVLPDAIADEMAQAFWARGTVTVGHAGAESWREAMKDAYRVLLDRLP